MMEQKEFTERFTLTLERTKDRGKLEDILDELTQARVIRLEGPELEGWESKKEKYYRIILSDEYGRAMCEGEYCNIDRLYAFVPKKQFYEFVKEAIAEGESIIIPSFVYECTGCTWMSDIASGQNSSSGYYLGGPLIDFKIKHIQINQVSIDRGVI